MNKAVCGTGCSFVGYHRLMHLLLRSYFVLLKTRRTIGDMIVRSEKMWCKMIFDTGDWYYSELTLIEEAA